MTDNVVGSDDFRRERIAKDTDRAVQKAGQPVQALLNDIARVRYGLSSLILSMSRSDYDEVGNLTLVTLEGRLRTASTLLECASEQLGCALSIAGDAA